MATGPLDWFAPPATEDSPRQQERLVRARVLVATCFGLVAFAIPLMVRDYFMEGYASPTVIIFALSSLAMGINPFLLRKTGAIRVIGGIATIELMVTLGAMAFMNHGFESGALMWNTVVPLVAMFVVGPRFALVCTALVAAETVGFYIADRNGFPFPAPLGPADLAWWQMAGIATSIPFIGLFTFVYHRSRQRVLEQARSSELAAQRAEAQIGSILENLATGMLVQEHDGTIVYANRSFCVLFEISRGPLSVVGRGDHDVAESGKALLQNPYAVARALESARTHDVDGPVDLRLKNGRVVEMEFAALQIDEETCRHIWQLRDVTPRRRAETLRNKFIEQVVSAQDEERRRISQDLHDRVGASLTTLLIALPRLQKEIESAKALEVIQHLESTVEHTYDEIAQIVKGLHPRILDDLGFVEALKRYTQDWERLHGTDVSVHINGLQDRDDLPRVIAVTLYRIVQEALSNVARHAGADNVGVVVDCDGATVRVVIEDDGQGFDPAATGDIDSLGLQGIRERVAFLNGSVDVESVVGGGSALFVRIPLQPGEASA